MINAYLLNRHGLRTSIIFAVIIQMIGSWLRYVSVKDDHGARENGFIALFIGQFLCALVQPVFLNSCTKLAGDWFSSEQRNLATTIASMSNPVTIYFSTQTYTYIYIHLYSQTHSIHTLVFFCMFV